MDKEHQNNTIKNIVAGAYNIEPIISVKKFNLTFSKFTTQNYHFIVKTSRNTYFLKRDNIHNLSKNLSEIYSINIFKKNFNIPEILQTKKGGKYFIKKNNIFVLYKYVNAPNLKDAKENLRSFFKIVCDVESKLIKLKTNNRSFFNFRPRISKFESTSKKLLDILKNDKRPRAQKDIEYLTYLIKEVEKIKVKILKLKIRKNFIHGDLLMQNIIRDNNKMLWIVDWEKSKEYITSIDILKSITFTIFNTLKTDMNLRPDMFIKWSIYCFNNIPISKKEMLNAFNLYYFHLITGVDFLKKIYVEKQKLNEKMLDEDFLICKWFKKNKKEMQSKLNQGLL